MYHFNKTKVKKTAIIEENKLSTRIQSKIKLNPINNSPDIAVTGRYFNGVIEVTQL